MEKTAKEEIPDTEQGIKIYMTYAEKQIKENLLHNRRLQTRLKWCEDKLHEYKKTLNNNPNR